MKPIIFLTAVMAALKATATDYGDTYVTWQSLGNTFHNNKPEYVQRFIVTGNTNIQGLAFNMFARKMEMTNPKDTLIELVPGYYLIKTPRFDGSDKVTFEIKTSGQIANCCNAPDGVHTVNFDGTTTASVYTRLPLDTKLQWMQKGKDIMTYGPEIYATNAQRATDWQPGPYDVIPAFKSVELTEGTSQIPLNPVFRNISHSNPDYSVITIRNDSIIIECLPDKQWSVYYHMKAKVLEPNKGKRLPNAVITNYPDHRWRGQHIDIARNFSAPKTMHKILEIMAVNRLNKLHFHIVDDEAWRLEISGMPELTNVGARRGFSTEGEQDYLYQIFSGDGNPDTQSGTSNGFWTRQEYIDFIRRAHILGIDVIPEIESPGHARAAIKAMEKRHANGDDTYRLIHDGDTSLYTSAQAFHDNVMNPALPGPYRFMDRIFDELIGIYAEAGVPLIGIHIGGDEVPRGSWGGSEIAQQFMKEHGMKSQRELHAYFVRQMAKSLKQRGVPMFGWEEIAVGHGDDFNREVAPITAGVNCWHTTPDAAIKSVKAGYPVILSNVNRFYLDMAASRHPEERGLTWGGTVDEFDALGGYLSQMCPVNLDSVPGSVIGVQGQLWAETIRNEDGITTLLLPKIQGLAERAWNAEPTWNEQQFNAIIGEKELPLYTNAPASLKVHIRQPGIMVKKGKVYMNAPYSGGEIRYTTDGTEPTEKSPIYTKPFKKGKHDDIRAKYFRNGSQSVTTYLSAN